MYIFCSKALADALNIKKNELHKVSAEAQIDDLYAWHGHITKLNEAHQSLYVEFLYVADCNKDIVKLQKDETIAYKWVTRDEILNMQDNMASSRALRMLIEQRF